jgi:eukaryotic-like serine/threonine-protein kinase
LRLFTVLLVLLHMQTVFEPPQLRSVGPVAQYPNIIASTWVLGDLEITTDGTVKSATTRTGNSLPGTVLATVSRWGFIPASATTPVESHVTSIFLFRARDIFSSPAPDLSGVSIAGLSRPPIPINLSDPGYMATSTAEGQVILELRLSDTGAIQDVRVVQGIAGFNEFTERAVRSWRFVPALWNGTPVPGTVIVVVSYLRPAV